MKTLAAGLVLAISATAAHADVRIYNASQSKVTVDVTMPNGKVKSNKLEPAVDSVDDETWLMGLGVKTVKVAITDEAGTNLWSGSLDANDTGALVPSGKGVAFVRTGTYAGDFSTPKAVAFMNITGDSIKLDLEGHNGVGAHCDITPPTSFDLKKLLFMDPRESTFTVTIKKAGEEPIELDGQALGSGHHVLVWKRSRDGAYRLLSAGYLPSPPKKKK